MRLDALTDIELAYAGAKSSDPLTQALAERLEAQLNPATALGLDAYLALHGAPSVKALALLFPDRLLDVFIQAIRDAQPRQGELF